MDSHNCLHSKNRKDINHQKQNQIPSHFKKIYFGTVNVTNSYLDELFIGMQWNPNLRSLLMLGTILKGICPNSSPDRVTVKQILEISIWHALDNISLSEIKRLKNLTVLRIYSTNIHDLDGISSLKKLQKLHYSKHRSNFQPINSRDLRNMTKSLRVLSFNGNETLKILKDVKYLANLIVLDVSRNKLQGSLWDIRNLEKLKQLDCSENKIISLKGIEKMKNLRTLKVSYNRLKHVNVFRYLKNLERLVNFLCRSNQIETLSGFPGSSLKNLKNMNIQRNEICGSFDGLRDLKNLAALYCDRNKFDGSFVGLQNISALKNLGCSNNFFKSFKGLPLNIKDFRFYHCNILRIRYFDKLSESGDSIKEDAGTSKFFILEKQIICGDNSFFSWYLGDKNILNKLYDYF